MKVQPAHSHGSRFVTGMPHGYAISPHSRAVNLRCCGAKEIPGKPTKRTGGFIKQHGNLTAHVGFALANTGNNLLVKSSEHEQPCKNGSVSDSMAWIVRWKNMDLRSKSPPVQNALLKNWVTCG